MASEHQLVRHQPAPALSRQEMEKEAEGLLKSGYFPHIKSVASAVTIILKGRELGLPPVQALQKLYVVQGQVTCAVEVMAALAAQSKVITWEVKVNTNTEAEILFERWDNPHRQPMTYISRFTIEDAKRMGKVTERGTYITQPQIMLLRRAMGLGLRQIAPDIISGMYAFEEMGIEQEAPDSFKPRIVDEKIVQDPDANTIGVDFEAVNEALDEDVSETITAADAQEFRDWTKKHSEEMKLPKGAMNTAVHECLRGKQLEDLTTAELDVLYDDLRNFQYSSVTEEESQ